MRSLNPRYASGWNVAIEWLNSGKNVTRCSWSDHFYYPVYIFKYTPQLPLTEPFIAMVNMRPEKPRLIPWQPGTLDFLAADWMIYHHLPQKEEA